MRTSTAFFARPHTAARRGECFVAERLSGARLLDGRVIRWFEVHRRGWFFDDFIDAFIDERTATDVCFAINARRRHPDTYNGAAVRPGDPRLAEKT